MNAENKPVRKVVIVGGGTAGWVAAIALSQQLKELLDITLIESEEIGTVGVGEATIPTMSAFHRLIRIDEQEFMRRTEATFKLGISFENWGAVGEKYFHAFGITGKATWLAEFLHFWLRARELGWTNDIGEFCREWVAAKEGRFGKGPGMEVSYAYHLDAGFYARYLRELSEKNGVKRVEGKVVSVNLNPDDGNIESVSMNSGDTIVGDLFIDCSGFRGLLIEEAMQAGYEDWSEWLLCNSAVAMQTSAAEEAIPYTRSIAYGAGWRWKIPLQHRVGNGFVFSKEHISDDEAIALLKKEVTGEPLNEPRIIRFKPGKRKNYWVKNCVAMGLASGFLEPLESTSIHLFMNAVTRLMHLFPFDGIKPSLVKEYNAEAHLELESIRDFIILHYHVTRRDDSEFWRYCKNMSIPPSLKHRIEMFAENAQTFQKGKELFRVDSWNQVMLGQGLLPKDYHRFVDIMQQDDLKTFLASLKNTISQQVAAMPPHHEFVEKYCQVS